MRRVYITFLLLQVSPWEASSVPTECAALHGAPSKALEPQGSPFKRASKLSDKFIESHRKHTAFSCKGIGFYKAIGAPQVYKDIGAQRGASR